MNIWLAGAGALCAIVALTHIIAGGKFVAQPLLKAKDLNATAKYTQYYCWHLVSITLVAMTVAFAWAAVSPSAVELAWLAGALALAFCVWGCALPPSVKQSYKLMPQGWLFAPIALLTVPGLAT